jgi:hypothetical protein
MHWLNADCIYVENYFGKNNVIFNIDSKGVYCEINTRETKYRFVACTVEQLLGLIADEFYSSDESYDGEFAVYTTWTNIKGLKKYHNAKHNVI